MSKNNPEIQNLSKEANAFDFNKQSAKDMLSLATVQTAQIALDDTAAFLRNNHMIYTAGIASVVRALIDGNEKAHESFALLNDMLSKSEKHFDHMVQSTNELMEASRSSSKE